MLQIETERELSVANKLIDALENANGVVGVYHNVGWILILV